MIGQGELGRSGLGNVVGERGTESGLGVWCGGFNTLVFVSCPQSFWITSSGIGEQYAFLTGFPERPKD